MIIELQNKIINLDGWTTIAYGQFNKYEKNDQMDIKDWGYEITIDFKVSEKTSIWFRTESGMNEALEEIRKVLGIDNE